MINIAHSSTAKIITFCTDFKFSVYITHGKPANTPCYFIIWHRTCKDCSKTFLHCVSKDSKYTLTQTKVKRTVSSRRRPSLKRWHVRNNDAYELSVQCEHFRCEDLATRDAPATANVLVISRVISCFFAFSLGSNVRSSPPFICLLLRNYHIPV